MLPGHRSRLIWSLSDQATTGDKKDEKSKLRINSFPCDETTTTKDNDVLLENAMTFSAHVSN